MKKQMFALALVAGALTGFTSQAKADTYKVCVDRQGGAYIESKMGFASANGPARTNSGVDLTTAFARLQVVTGETDADLAVLTELSIELRPLVSGVMLKESDEGPKLMKSGNFYLLCSGTINEDELSFTEVSGRLAEFRKY